MANAVLWYVVFLASTVVHEAAHAWTAFRLGDPTAYHGGQVTLDPRPHVRREPIGTVVVPLASILLGGMMIGWASTPYDPEWASRHPRRAATMALAGPVANVLLVVLAAVIIRVGVGEGVFGAPRRLSPMTIAIGPAGVWGDAARVLSMVFSLNVTLATLNLLPIPPLDGSGAIQLLLPERMARGWRTMLLQQRGLLVIGLVLAFQVVGTVIDRALMASANVLWTGVSAYR
jgi:Zn-dependent protease